MVKYTKILIDEMRSLASMTSYGVDRPMKDTDVVSEYGATPVVLILLWKLLCPHLTSNSKPHHMLWWLYQCKHYPTKAILQKVLRVSAPTSRLAMAPIKEAFIKIRNKVVSPRIVSTHLKNKHSSHSFPPFSPTEIQQIRFENRLKEDKGKTCKIYHDGVDFKCFNRRNPEQENRPEWRRYPFDPSYHSHKFKAAGLRYGVSTCIQTGEIVSCHGPFKARKWADITIYRKHVKPMLRPGEMVEADAGYHADPTVRGPSDYCCQSEKSAKKKVAGRHETINGRLETFRCLRHQFRHNHHQHKFYFYTAAVTTQLMLRKYGTYSCSY